MPSPAPSADAPFSLHRAFQLWRLPLLRFLQRKLGNASDAEDMLQESFARWAAAERNGTVVERPRQFVFEVASNLAYDHLRYTLRRKDLLHTTDGLADDLGDNAPAHDAGAGEAANPATRAEHRQTLALLESAIGELPPRQREALVLSRFDGLTQDQIAQRMGISRRMVVRHLSHALAYCELRTEYARAHAQSAEPEAAEAQP